MSLLNCFIVCQSFLKIMFFLRVFEQFGLLVDLVAQALSDSIPFTCFLIMWLILFSLLFRILGFEIDDGDYSSMGQASIYALQTYRNSVGDIAAPAYSFWESQTDFPHLQSKMIMIIWFAWLMNQFFLTIILLNFLIAILAESFTVVMEQELQCKYKSKVALNKETFLTLKAFNMLTPFEGFLLAAQTPALPDPDPIKEAQDEIQEVQHGILSDLGDMHSEITTIKELLS